MLDRISLAKHWEESWKRNNPMKSIENFVSHILHSKGLWSDGYLPLEGHGNAWLQRSGLRRREDHHVGPDQLGQSLGAVLEEKQSNEKFCSHILHPKDCWSDWYLPLEGHGSAWLQRHGVIGGGMIIMLDRISLANHWEQSWKRNNPMKTFEICFTHFAL